MFISVSHIKLSRQNKLILIGILFLTGLICVITFFLFERQKRIKNEMNFRLISQEFTHILNLEINQQLQTLTALNAFYLSSDYVSYQEFQQFTKPFLVKNKAIKALEWAPKVPYEQKDFFESQLKKEANISKFQFTELDSNGLIKAVNQRPYYYPIYYVQPILSNELVWGFDLASEKLRNSALEKSFETNSIVASKPVQLLQNVGKNSYGILVIQAVIKNGKNQGFVVVVYDINDLFTKKIISQENHQMDMYLFADNQLVFTNTTNQLMQNKFTITEKIVFANEEWTLILSPNELFFSSEYLWVSFIVILLIILLGIGTFFIVYLNLIQKEITEQRVEEKTRELRLSNQELEQFAYITSHDLQEPLYTLKSYVGLFQDLYKQEIDEQGITFLQFAVDAADRMQQMLHELLMFSSLGRQKEFREIDTNLLLKIVLDEFDEKFVKNAVQINKVNLPRIYGDFIEIKKLFTNIIDNSFKFRHKERNLIISIFVESITNKFVKISIHDNGIGISKDHFERIFVIFQRLHTRNQYDGNGIGLAVCKKIVSLHGGEISVKSDINQGTTITFTLPII